MSRDDAELMTSDFTATEHGDPVLTSVQLEALDAVAAGQIKVRHTSAGAVYFTHVAGSGHGSVFQVARLRAAGLVRVTGGGRARLTAAGRRARSGADREAPQ